VVGLLRRSFVGKHGRASGVSAPASQIERLLCCGSTEDLRFNEAAGYCSPNSPSLPAPRADEYTGMGPRRIPEQEVPVPSPSYSVQISSNAYRSGLP